MEWKWSRRHTKCTKNIIIQNTFVLLSMEFSRQEDWHGLPLPSPDQGLNLSLLCLLQWQANSLHCARWEAHLLKKRSSLSSSQVLLLIASANNCQPFLALRSKSLVSTLCEMFIYSSHKLFNLGTIFTCLKMRVKVRLSICLRSQA